MHIWIVLAALAFCAVTPYLGGAPDRSDFAQMMEEQDELDQISGEAGDDDRQA